MKQKLLSILLFCMCALTGYAAINYNLQQSFEDGVIPSDWSQEYISSNQTDWIVDTISSNPNGAADGNYRAAIRNLSTNEAIITKLITPPMNLMNIEPQLTFAYALPKRANLFSDTLKVYYRPSASDPWVYMYTYGEAQNAWQQVVLQDLPAGCQSAYCQFAFEAKLAGGLGVVLDDIKVFPISQCLPAAFDMGNTAIGADYADIFFTGDLNETFELLVTTEPVQDFETYSLDQPSQPESVIYHQDGILASEGFVPVEPLTPQTMYYAYLRSTCRDNETGYTEWVSYSFKTPCQPMIVTKDAPWVENFEGFQAGELSADCWNNLHLDGAGAKLFTVYNTTAQGGNSTMLLQLPDMSSGTMTLLTLPNFTSEEADAYAFSMSIYRNTTSYAAEGIRVFASKSEDFDESTAVELAFLGRNYTVADAAHGVPAESASGWYTYEFSIPLEGNVYIHLRGESKFGSATYMDNFKIRKLPACKKLSDLRVSDIQRRQASIAFTAANASQFQVFVADSPIDPDTIQDMSVLIYETTSQNDSIVIPGLVGATKYYVYVRGLCPNEDPSEWISTSFLTLCDVLTITADGWSEGFENMEQGSSSSEAPLCWDLLNANDGSYPYIYVNNSSSYVHSGSKSLYFQSSSSRYGYAIFPEINQVNNFEVQFDYKDESATSSGYLYLGYMTDITNESSFVQLAEFDRSNNWQHGTATTAAIPEDVVASARLAFKYGGASNNFYLGIDDIVITPLPDCRNLDAVTVSGKTTQGATFTIDISKPADQYQLVIAKASINPDNFATDTNVLHNGIYDNPLIAYEDAQLLEPNTTYYAYLRAYCSENEQGTWFREVPFKTLCLPTALADFGTETFEDASTIDCWEMGVLTKGKSSPIVHKRDSSAAFGAHLYLARTSAAVDGDDAPYAVSPKLEFENGEDIRNYQVVFDAASSRNVPTNLRRLSVHVTIDPLDMSTSRPIKILTVPVASNAQGEQTFTISFAGYTGIRGVYGQYVVFQAEEAASHDSTNYIVIDNIRFEPASSCPQLVETAISATTLHGASMSWEDVEAPAYQVMVLPQAVQQPESIEGAVFSDIVTTNSAEFSGLEASTTYYAYVRAICAEGDTAQWSNPVAFKTNQGIPYSEAFATALFPAGWNTYSGAFSDSILTSALSVESQTTYSNVVCNWELTTANRPTGMSGYVARTFIYYSSGYTSWLVSPTIDMADVTADQFVRLTFSAARGGTNYQAATNIAPGSVSGYKFYVLVSEDNGVSWKQADATMWRTDGSGDFDYNAIGQEASSYQVGLTKYAGKKIKIAFYTESASSSPCNFVYVDDINIETYEAVCMGVRKLAVKATSDSAYVSWEIEGTPAKTILVLSDSANFAHVVDSVVVENAYTCSFADLAPATTYYVRAMQADCESAEWVSKSFVTECAVISSLPWSENFNALTSGIPMCWDNSEGTTTTATSKWNYYASGHEGACLRFNSYSNSNGNTNILALPAIQLPQEPMILSFYWKNPTGGAGEVLISTDGGATRVVLDSNMVAVSAWTEYQIDLAQYAGQTVIVYFAATSNYGNGDAYLYLDDVKIKQTPACSNLSGVIAVDSIAQDQASIRFEGNGAPMYQVIVSTKLYEDTEAITPESLTPEDTAAVAYADIITDTAFVATGLQHSTTYYVYIRAVCDPLHMSDWAGTSFVTSCGAVASFPWAEDFNSLTSGIPMCWDNSEGTTTTATYKWNYYATGHEGKGLRFNSYLNSNGNTNILALPAIQLPQEPMILSFYWKNPTGGAGEVLISTDGGATRTVLENQLTGISAWTQFEIDLSSYTGNTVNIYFSGTSNYGDGDAYLYLDDILVKALPSCKKLTDIAINAIGSDSAVVIFTDSVNNAGLYHLIVANAAIDFSSALSAQDSAHIVVDDSTLQASPAVLRGLTPATDYFVYLAARCDEVQSDWSSAVRFATACVPVANLPWAEDFENIATGTLAEHCWLNYHNAGSGTTVATVSSTTYSNGSAHTLYMPYLSTGNKVLVATPQIVIPEPNEYEFRLDVYRNATSYAAEGLRIYASTSDTIDSIAAVELAFISRKYAEADSIHGVPAEDATGWYTYSFPISLAGEVRIIMQYEGAGGSGIYLDNLLLRHVPACADMKGIKVKDITGESATLQLDSVARFYQLVVAKKAINPDTLELVPDVDLAFSGNIMLDENHEFPMEHLFQGRTSYYVYLRTVCGDDEAGAWSNEVTFTTSCASITIEANAPWTEDFEGYDASTHTYSTTNGIVPDCWSASATNSSQIAPHIIGSGSYHYVNSGTQSLSFYGSGNCYAVLPPFANPINTLQIAFYMQTESSTNGTLTLGYITAADMAMNTFQPIASFDNSYGSMSLRDVDLTDVPDEATQLVFRWYYSGQWSCCIDDITITKLPDCREINNVNVSEIGTASAKVSFSNTKAPNYQLILASEQLDPSYIDSLNGLDPSKVIRVDLIDTTVIAYDSLAPSTTYYGYVRGICGDAETSGWKSYSFMTSCIASVPFLENFDSNDNHKHLGDGLWIPACFNETYSDNAYYAAVDNEDSLQTSSYSYFFASSGNSALHISSSSANPVCVILPAMDVALDSLQISFKARAMYAAETNLTQEQTVYSYASSSYAHSITVGTITDPQDLSTFQLLETYPLTEYATAPASLSEDPNNFWETVTVYLQGGASGKYIALLSSFGKANEVWIDDIEVSYAPDCTAPSGVTATAADTRVDLAWSGGADQYRIAIGLAGFNPDTVSAVYVTDYLDLTIDYLQPSTDYEVYVMSTCFTDAGVIYSPWSRVCAFHTNCEAIEITATTPWTEDFESYTNGYSGSAPTHTYNSLDYALSAECWTNEHLEGSGTYLFSIFEPTSNLGGNSTKQLYLPDMTSGTKTHLALPPMMIAEADQFAFSLDVYRAASGTSAVKEGIRVFVSHSSELDDSAIELGFISRNYTVADTAHGIPAESAIGWYNYELTLPISGYVFVHLRGESLYSLYTSMDNFRVRKLPVCKQVQGLAVSDVTGNGATLNYASSNANYYSVILASEAINPDSINVIADSLIAFRNDSLYWWDTTVVFSQLSAQTTYYAYVRGLCEGEIPAEWNAIQFKTPCDAISTFPWSDDFEGYAAGTGTSGSVPAPGCWASLNAESGPYAYVHSSSSYNYIGSGSQYLFFNGSSGSVSKLAHFILPRMESLNSLQVRFKYAFEGTSSGDFIVGYMTDVTNQNSFHAIETISNNVTAKTAYQSAWISMESVPDSLLGKARIAIRYAGTSNWYANVDDIEVQVLPTCRGIRGISVVDKTDNSAVVSFLSSGAANYQVLVASAPVSIDSLSAIDSTKIVFNDAQLVDTFALVSGLNANTAYYAYVRGLCGNEQSEWSSPVAFRTECAIVSALPWAEDFDDAENRNKIEGTTYYIPYCWNEEHTSTTYSTHIIDNTSSATYSRSGMSALRIYTYVSSTATNTSYIVLPQMAYNEEVPAQLTFSARALYAGTSTITNYSTSAYAHSIKIGLVSDPNDISTFELVREIVLKERSSVTYSDLTADPNLLWENIKLVLPALQGKRIVFLSDYDKSNYVYIDDIAISEYNATCEGINDIQLSNASATGVDVLFHFVGDSVANARIALSATAELDLDNVLLLDTIENDTTYAIRAALNYSSTYYVFVQQICGEDGESGWARASFNTPYGIRYAPNFAQDGILGDWSMYSGLYNNSGTATLSSGSGWAVTTSYNVIGQADVKANIYGTSSYKWLVTPAIDLSRNAGEGLLLSFEAALTKWNSRENSTGDVTDDRMLVLVTTDECQTWTVLAEWNNAGTGDYRYDALTNVGTQYHLNMSNFGGQPAVRIAFYGESTQSGADNDLHIGNVVLDRVAAVTYSGHVCEGSDYNGAADGNPFNIAADQYVRGMNVFSEFRPAEDDLDIDSMLILNLMVDTAVYHDYYAVLCEGEHYSNYGWDFVAELNMSDKAFFLQTVNGCDSVVRLVITVNPKQTVHIYDTVTIGDAYIWQGEEIYTAGTYPFNTHSVVTGCDSTAVLHLATKLPTALSEASANKLMLTPNPVEVGQPVQVLNDFSAAELADAKIEVFSASGMLLYSAHGAAQPFIIPGMSVSGLHYVRITVADKVYNSPLLVK